MSPDYMSELFTYTHEVGAYNTRSTVHKILCVLKVNRHIFSQSIQYNGPRIWNSLPIELHTAESLNIFKSRLKAFILF